MVTDEVVSCSCSEDDCACIDTCVCIECGCPKCDGGMMECACGGNCGCGAADGEDDDEALALIVTTLYGQIPISRTV